MKNRMMISIMFFLWIGSIVEGAAYPPNGWRMPSVFVDQPDQQKFSEIYVKGDTIHTIWIDKRSGTYQLYYKRSTDAGFTWNDDLPISLSNELIPDRKRNFSIAGRNNDVYIVYGVQGLGYELKFVRSSDNGNSWGSHTTLASSISCQVDPSICVSSDSIRVVYCHYTGITQKIYYCASGNNGGRWKRDSINFYMTPASCPDITTFHNRPHVAFVIPGGNVGWIYFAKHTSGAWEVINILTGLPPSEYVFPHINANFDGDLYVVFEDTLRNHPGLGEINAFWSTNGGINWDGGFISPGNREGSDFISLGGDSILITSGDQGNVYGQIVLFTPTGPEPRNPFIISDEYTDPPACKPHTCISQGRFARHLIFHSSFANVQNLAYIANEDSLLSDDEAATAENNGRHLVRDPFSGILHVVYQSQLMVHYAESFDGGLSWQPFHIMEDPITQEKEDGRFPTIGLVPGWFTSKPCVAYVQGQGTIQYRWYDDFTSQWRGFTVLPVSLGLEAQAPSIYTQGDQVYLVFSVTFWEGDQIWSAIYFYQFPYDATSSPDPVVLDYIGWQGLMYGYPTITVDGNGDPHVAWSRINVPGGDEEIFYSWRTGGSWSPPLNISIQPDLRSTYPNTDCYGNDLSVVWNDVVNGQFDEIWRNKKDIPTEQWSGKDPVSESPGIISEFAVNAAHDFTVWNEQPANNFDIRYYSNTYGYGWVSQNSEKEYHCHTQLQRDYSPWDLYTVYTRGDNLPYRIICTHQQFEAGPPGTGSALYSVEPGDTLISPFCRHRDGHINYGPYRVDYGNQDITYELSLLDPTFPYHKITGTLYFEGNGNRMHDIWINGEKKGTLNVNPNQARYFEFLLPMRLYDNDHKVTISLKNPQNIGAYLADLKVFRIVTTDTVSGGPQSFSTSNCSNLVLIACRPNPFTDRISFTLAGFTKSCHPVNISIYDASGRLIKKWIKPSTLDVGSITIYWDGTNDACQMVPVGIYFIRAETGICSLTEKIIKIR